MTLNSIILNIVAFGIGIIGLLIVAEYFIRSQQKAHEEKQELTTLLIRVARDNEAGPIVAEQMFATLHGVIKNLSFWDRLKGQTQDRMSFEIASTKKSIRFYATFPEKLQSLVEGQIYAQYPNVEISRVEDYAKPQGIEVSEAQAMNKIQPEGSSRVPLTKTKELNPQSPQNTKALANLEEASKEKIRKNFKAIEEFKYAISTDLSLSSLELFPIKRYPQFDDKKAKVVLDPLSAITSTLATFNNPEEQAWIQIIARPLPERWRGIFRNCLKVLNKGIYGNIATFQQWYARTYCTRSQIIRIIFFPLYFLFKVQSLGLGKGEENKKPDLSDEASRSHEGESSMDAAVDKLNKLLYEVNIRIVYVPKNNNKEAAMVKLREVAGAFKQFSVPQVNGFVMGDVSYGEAAIKKYQNRELHKPYALSVEELATIFHLPNITVTTPNIYWVRSRRLEPPEDLPLANNEAEENVTALGKTNFRGNNQTFGIKKLDRRRHIYIIGKTGMGKSTLLENMIFSDIQAGRGLAVVDPHGDLADAVINFIPSHRTNDVVIFDPSDREFPVAFNMLENIDPALNSIVCSGLVGIFKKIYGHSWGPRLEHILRNTILSLLMYPNTTMLGIPRILQDYKFRRQVVRKITDPIVKSFWENEFEQLEPRQKIEAISPILNKVGQFLSSPIARNILGQPKSAIDLRFAMDKKKIVIVNLSKGKIGEDMSSLLGAMMITKFQLDAMSRANVAEAERTDFYLYVDEFQNFATDSFATILSEARKYRLNLTMANQYIAQMPEEVRDAVFGNVGSIISFQVGFDDAEYLSNQFGEQALPTDLVAMNKYTAYSRLLIDGMPSTTFSLDTLPPPEFSVDPDRREKIIRLARERYSNPRELVEDKIRRWSEGPKKLSESSQKNQSSTTDAPGNSTPAKN